MMLGTALTVAYLDYKVTRDDASKRVTKALERIALGHRTDNGRSDGDDDFDHILKANEGLGRDLLRPDNQVLACFLGRDREKMISNLKSYLSRTSFNGIITFVDERGAVFYSSDIAGKDSYSVRSNAAFRTFFDGGRREPVQTPALFTRTQNMTLSALVPIMNSKGLAGVLAVSTPVDTEFLSGLTEKLAISRSSHRYRHRHARWSRSACRCDAAALLS